MTPATANPLILGLFPAAMSTLASRVDHLALLLLAFCGFLAISVCLTIIYFCVRYRARPERRYYPKSNGFLPLEIAWTVGPVLISLIFFAWGAKIFLDGARPPANSTDILLVGKQWFWEFQHENGVREVGLLHVPVHRPIRLLMTSEDVIHSFYVPAFRLKQDVLPLQYTVTWFEAKEPGTYRINCTEFCGAMHAKMDGRLIVLSAADYAEWTARQAPATSLVDSGRELFAHYGCADCHRPGMAHMAPELDNLYGSTVWLSDGRSLTADEDYLRESIVDPAAKIVAGYRPIMPVYGGRLTQRELLAIVTYLKHLPGKAADPAAADHAHEEP